MLVKDARRALKVPEVYNDEDVKGLFRAHAKEAHPDNGGQGADLARLKEARDVLLADLRAQEQVCGACDGKGTIRKGFVSSVCRTCGGEGR